ncbi:DUF4265 domain-containing protein [Dactylosporangium sp. NPDC049525]|uniref:DUF4265 domain-containing protein n=1 Tax=Dactylosporangium sp. NPDC049525 TaxID=3154730 RepID=UPI003444245B
MQHVYVALERDADGYPPFEAEEIDAVEVGRGRFRIEGIPVFVYGMARGDVVRVKRTRGDDRLWVTAVVSNSEHWTSRVVPVDRTTLEQVAQQFVALGCDAHATAFGMVAVDVPASVRAATVVEVLRHGQDAGIWHYDMGVAPA